MSESNTAAEHDAALLASGMKRFTVTAAGTPMGEVIAPDEATALAKFRDLNRGAPPDLKATPA